MGDGVGAGGQRGSHVTRGHVTHPIHPSLPFALPSVRQERGFIVFKRGRLRDNGDDVIIAGMTSPCMLCIVFRLASASATDTLQAAQPDRRGHTFHTTC